LQERSSGLSQTVNALRRVGYKFDEVVDYAKQVQSAVRKISQPKSDDIFKRLLKNAN
jgi:Holliday junction resolvasome RuvABC DNA-binding subunit